MVNTYTDICRVEDRILAGALLFSHRNGHEDFFIGARMDIPNKISCEAREENE